MTVGGIIISCFLCILPIIAIIVCASLLKEGLSDHVGALIAGIIISVLVIVGIWVSMFWYYNSTASGQRAMKTQRSELGDGIQRELTVYDMQGEVIAHYEGKFDIDFGSDSRGQRIMFDDEQGVRHVIYPGGGIVIVNEVPGK